MQRLPPLPVRGERGGVRGVRPHCWASLITNFGAFVDIGVHQDGLVRCWADRTLTTSPATSPLSRNPNRPCSNSPPPDPHNLLAVRLRARVGRRSAPTSLSSLKSPQVLGLDFTGSVRAIAIAVHLRLVERHPVELDRTFATTHDSSTPEPMHSAFEVARHLGGFGDAPRARLRPVPVREDSYAFVSLQFHPLPLAQPAALTLLPRVCPSNDLAFSGGAQAPTAIPG